MKCLHKTAALLTAILMGAVLCTGCKNQNQPSYTEEELPYGATMRESKTGYAVPISYDRRFVNEEQVKVLTDYLSAIQTCDGELYKTNTLDFYAEYQLNEVYEGQYANYDEMIGALHAAIAEMTAEDFTFTMVTVENFTQERVASGLDGMIDILTDFSDDENFSQTLDNCWAVEMQWLMHYNGGASSVIVNEQRLYMFEIDGQYYCVM